MTNLTLDEKKALIRMALEAREQAYVPYSVSYTHLRAHET